MPVEKRKTPQEQKVRDLSRGYDVRGDRAYFIERRHFRGWKVDERARTHEQDVVFFRIIENGKQTPTHGYLRDDKVIQWG